MSQRAVTLLPRKPAYSPISCSVLATCRSSIYILLCHEEKHNLGYIFYSELNDVLHSDSDEKKGRLLDCPPYAKIV